MLETEHGHVHLGRTEVHQLTRKLQETDLVQEQMLQLYFLVIRFTSLEVTEAITINELHSTTFMLMT